MRLYEYHFPQKGQYYRSKSGVWGDRIFKVIDTDNLYIYYIDVGPIVPSAPKKMTLGIFLNAIRWGWIEKYIIKDEA